MTKAELKSDELRALAIKHPDLFTKWAMINHGGCTKEHLEEHEIEGECEVYALLQKDEYTTNELLDAVDEADGDWEESWENYLTDKGII